MITAPPLFSIDILFPLSVQNQEYDLVCSLAYLLCCSGAGTALINRVLELLPEVPPALLLSHSIVVNV